VRVLRKNKIGFVDLEIPSKSDPIKMVQLYLSSGLVEVAEPNTFGIFLGFPNDSLFVYQWNLNQQNDADIDAPEAWDIKTGRSSVVVGVLDSGTDWGHEDLDENIWRNPGEDSWSNPNDPNSGNGVDDDGNGFVDDWKGWDFANNNNDSRGPFWHGTSIAGICGAETNNDTGVAGIAGGWSGTGAKLLICQVGDWMPDGSVVDDAILYAVETGARIINMSFSIGQNPAVDAAIQFAYEQYECVLIAASGNSGGAVSYPAKHSCVIAVGATDSNDIRPEWSNHGPELEVVAPGVEILSTRPNSNYSSQNTDTSFTAPHVSGIVALLLSTNPDLTPDEIREIMQSTVEDKGEPRFDEYYGYGRVNAYKALKYALEHYGGMITKSFTIPPGETWTFQPGVTLKFADDVSLTVNGVVTVQGTSTEPIIFTSSSSNPSPGSWYGIVVEDGGRIELNHAKVKYATYGVKSSYADV